MEVAASHGNATTIPNVAGVRHKTSENRTKVLPGLMTLDDLQRADELHG